MNLFRLSGRIPVQYPCYVCGQESIWERYYVTSAIFYCYDHVPRNPFCSCRLRYIDRRTRVKAKWSKKGGLKNPPEDFDSPKDSQGKYLPCKEYEPIYE
jgi:hypothetical protein